MIRKMIMIAMLGISAQSMAQENDLIFQIRLIKKIMPDATRFGLIYNPNRSEVEADIDRVTSETGMLVVKSPVTHLRDVGDVVRSLMQYEVDFIYMVEDSIITSGNGVKFTVRPTQRKGVPVFTKASDGLENGVFGQTFRAGGYWRMYINRETLDDFPLSIPEGSEDFIIR